MALPGLSSFSLPGLTLANPSHESPSGASPTTRRQTLRPETEFRFECSTGRPPISIKLVSGTAELFGTELAPNVAYALRDAKAAVFSWHGCELEIAGAVEAEYVAEETPMAQYANVHFALEDLRSEAADNLKATGGGGGRGGGVGGDTSGPRVMIVGPENAGKTSLAKILTAYALKSGRQPIMVNLDPRQGVLSVPGSLTATTFATLMDVEEGWGSSPISGPSAIPVKMPLCYQFGCQDPDDNPKLFKPMITRLALATTSRLEEDVETKIAGCIIDTPGSLSSGKAGGYEMIQHIASEFSVNALLVLGSERLYSEMRRRFAPNAPEDAVKIIKLDKSGGCVDRDESYMRQLRQAQIKQYFYGLGGMTLSPFTQLIDYNQVAIYRITEASESNAAFDPGADESDDDVYEPKLTMPGSNLYERMVPSLMLQNSLLAVTHADANDSQESIRDASVLWYVYVADVDDVKKKLKILNPVSGRVPFNALIWGSWPEDVADMVG